MTSGTVTVTVTDSGGHATSTTAGYAVGASTTTALPDFGVAGQPYVAMWLKTGKLVGTGETYQQAPLSTTASDSVVVNGTTPYFLLMVGGGSSAAISTDTEVSDITLLGNGTRASFTRYHGLRVGYSTGAKITRCTIRATPGTASSPPGEVFALPTWHANGVILTDVTIDGANVGATLWGATSCNGMTATRIKANRAQNGFGIAMFQCSGTRTITDSDISDNRKHVNIEQDGGGTIRFLRCDFRGVRSAAYIAQISTLGLSVSTKVIFEDCLFDSDVLVVNTYTTAANGGQNGQKDSDISRVDNGVTQPQGGPKFVIVHQ